MLFFIVHPNEKNIPDNRCMMAYLWLGTKGIKKLCKGTIASSEPYRSTFRKVRIASSRRLGVMLGGFFERGLAYASNGNRTANPVKWIFWLRQAQIYNVSM
jgi:hypothetical protein